MSPTQLRNIPVEEMTSERMLMPNWARTAARVLSDANMASTTKSNSTSALAEAQPMVIKSDPSFSSTTNSEEGRETVGGTVSRKGKWGFTCESCGWVPKKGDDPDWVPISQTTNDANMKTKYMPAHWPDRCKKCRSRAKRWTKAAQKYDQLEILRMMYPECNKQKCDCHWHCLRFLTLTKEEWNVILPLEQDTTCKSDCTHNACKCDHTECNGYQSKNTSGSYLWDEAEKLKKMATRQFRNWRNRNKYWISREAKGQAYYECTMKPVWKGWGWDEVQLHLHIHTVVCSKRIENKDIQIDINTLEEIPMSTTIQREWGGIVDVRACKTWKHKDGARKTSKRFVMNYLIDYINKSPHWQSVPFGDWSS